MRMMLEEKLVMSAGNRGFSSDSESCLYYLHNQNI